MTDEIGLAFQYSYKLIEEKSITNTIKKSYVSKLNRIKYPYAPHHHLTRLPCMTLNIKTTIFVLYIVLQ